MAVNSSAFAELQDSPDSSSSNSSTLLFLLRCFRFGTSINIATSFSITCAVLIIPLSIVILYLGFQRRGKSATTSQSDLFTYNMVVMGLIEILGSILFSVGLHTTFSELAYFGSGLFCLTWVVKLQFHTLTCVEHYLAVVHPVTYLGLKSKKGKRIRDLNICCIWLFLFICIGLVNERNDTAIFIMIFIVLSLAVMVICFCSISVLCALKRPGPGEASRDKVDPTKRRAFLTILTIAATVLLNLLWILVCDSLYMSLLLSDKDKCMVILSTPWLTLPCSVVLPLLYLHRAGKLPGCARSTT